MAQRDLSLHRLLNEGKQNWVVAVLENVAHEMQGAP